MPVHRRPGVVDQTGVQSGDQRAEKHLDIDKDDEPQRAPRLPALRWLCAQKFERRLQNRAEQYDREAEMDAPNGIAKPRRAFPIRSAPSTSRRNLEGRRAKTARSSVCSASAEYRRARRKTETEAGTRIRSTGRANDASIPTNRSTEIRQGSCRDFPACIAGCVGISRIRRPRPDDRAAGSRPSPGAIR